MMEYKGYYAAIRYDAEGEVLHGKVVGIRDVIYFKSESVDDLEKEFRFSIDDYLDWRQESGDPPNKPFTGNFVAHISPEIHRAAVFAAYEMGKRFDDWIADVFQTAIGETKTASRAQQPAAPNQKARN